MIIQTDSEIYEPLLPRQIQRLPRRAQGLLSPVSQTTPIPTPLHMTNTKTIHTQPNQTFTLKELVSNSDVRPKSRVINPKRILLRNLITTSSSKGVTFEPRLSTEIIPEGNQHLNGTRRTKHALSPSQQLDYYMCAVINNNATQIRPNYEQMSIKSRKPPPRQIHRPKYPQGYQKLLQKFESLRNPTLTDEQESSFQDLAKPFMKRFSEAKLKNLKNSETFIHRPAPLQSPKVDSKMFKKTSFQLEELSPGQKINRQSKQLFGSKAIRLMIATNDGTRTLKEKMKAVRIALLQTLIQLKKLKINPKELLDNKVFPTKPLENPLAKQFLQACKSNNIYMLGQLIAEQKYLVYEFDLLLMTGLHWACKRGYEDIAMKLLQNGADPDAQDIVGRTPLYISIDLGYNKLVKLLLFYQASPWNLDNCKYDELFPKNYEAQSIMSNARKLHILLRITPPAQRNAIWMKEQLSFYVDPTINVK